MENVKVSKILHASEGLEEQTNQQAELLKTAAYAAKSLAGKINALLGFRELAKNRLREQLYNE